MGGKVLNTEYNKKNNDEEIEYKLPFGGGAGAGVPIFNWHQLGNYWKY